MHTQSATIIQSSSHLLSLAVIIAQLSLLWPSRLAVPGALFSYLTVVLSNYSPEGEAFIYAFPLRAGFLDVMGTRDPIIRWDSSMW